MYSNKVNITLFKSFEKIDPNISAKNQKVND